MKELSWPKQLHILTCVGDAVTFQLDEPDNVAGPLLDVVGLAAEGGGRACPSTWKSMARAVG
eukprot:9133518-Alexandrium_andersonii.AAC.1